jgi:iron complex outermembrane receptor protein
MKTTRLPLALAVAAMPFALCAQENTLSTVTVADTPIKEAPTPNTVERKQVDRLRAATSDTATLLGDTPGVSLYGAGGVSSLPAVHGMADDRLRIKVDGMDLAAACPNHMNPPLSYLDPSNVGVLKVYAGIAPVSVGGDSIGGSIVADSVAPEFARAGEGAVAKGELGGFYRSNGNARGANASATWASDALNLSYSGAYAEAHNYRAGGDFKTSTATGRPGHTLGLDEVGSTAYQTRNQTLGVALRNANHLVDAKFGYQDIPYELYPNQRMDMLGNTERRFNLRYLGAFDWGGLEARAYHETVKHHMDFGADKKLNYGTLVPPNTTGATYSVDGMPMDTESRTTGATLKASINLAEQDVLRVGAEYLRYRLNDWWPPAPDCGVGNCVGGMAPLTFWNINGGERDRIGAFGEWEASWTPLWLSLLGLRFEQVKTDTGPVVGYNTSTTPLNTGMMMNMYETSSVGTRAAFNAMDRKRTDNNWDVTALGRYTPDTTSGYEFGYARKTRSPNLYERYSWSRNTMALEMNNFVGDGNGYLGNPDLKPEVAHTLSATGDWHSADGATGLRVTPYYTRVQDFIDAQQWNRTTNVAAAPLATNQFVIMKYANVAARLFGIDVSGRMPLVKTGLGEFGVKGLLSYTNGRNLDSDEGLYNIMPLNTKLTLGHEHAAWSNALEVVGVRAKTVVSDARNEVKTPGFGLVHLRASYSWKQARFDFGIENLFDKFYYQPTGGAYTGQGATMSLNREAGTIGTNGGTASYWGTAVPGMGRSFYAGLTVKL